MLLDFLKNYTLQDAIKIEQQDRQFLALKKLYKNKKFSDRLYLFLIIVNALVSFQLSGKGEDYWEEFSEKLLDFKENDDIYSFFESLLKNGKNNKRFVDMKLKRVEKILKYWTIDNIVGFENYYKNMDLLASDLAKIMNQKKDAKTIVFAVKMFSYGARNVFSYLEYFPFNLMIPIDSRLENIYEIENAKGTKKQIKEYYLKLAKKLNIPPLHLDAILWVNYEKIISFLKKV